MSDWTKRLGGFASSLPMDAPEVYRALDCIEAADRLAEALAGAGKIHCQNVRAEDEIRAALAAFEQARKGERG